MYRSSFASGCSAGKLPCTTDVVQGFPYSSADAADDALALALALSLLADELAELPPLPPQATSTAARAKAKAMTVNSSQARCALSSPFYNVPQGPAGSFCSSFTPTSRVPDKHEAARGRHGQRHRDGGKRRQGVASLSRA